MKGLVLFCGIILYSSTVMFAQHLDFQSNPNLNTESLFEKVTRLEKKTDMFNLYLNMQGSFNVDFSNDVSTLAAFRMRELRWEVKGNITDRIYYRFRQRLNRSNAALGLDNLPASIDYAAVGFRVTDDFAIFAGKQSTVFGGFEFDLNPIEVYQYCDMLEYMSNFLTGVDFAYNINKQHDLHFQVVDSRNGSFEEFYGNVPVGIEAPKVPLGYTLNWNGNMLDNKLKTRWSASIFHEAKEKNWYYYALGTEVNISKFLGFFDFMYSNENLDRTGIITMLANTGGFTSRALDTRYMSMILHLNYHIIPRLNLFVKGMYETAAVKKANQGLEEGKYRTSWGYLGGIEYYPMEENLHFFLTYIGRTYRYTDRAKAFGITDNDPQRIELGLVYMLPLF